MPQGGNVSERISLYNQRIAATRTMSMDTRLAELAALAEMALGYPLQEELLHQLYAIQTALHATESELEAQLDRGSITPDQYLEQTDSRFRSAMIQCKDLLGEDRFLKIFGDEALRPEGMTDREVFMADWAGRR